MEKIQKKVYRLDSVKDEITRGCDLKITKLSNGKGAVLPAIPDQEYNFGFKTSVEEVLGSGWEGLSLGVFCVQDVRITKSMVTRIRRAYETWTSLFLSVPHSPELEKQLKPRSFSTQNPN